MLSNQDAGLPSRPLLGVDNVKGFEFGDSTQSNVRGHYVRNPTSIAQIDGGRQVQAVERAETLSGNWSVSSKQSFCLPVMHNEEPGH